MASFDMAMSGQTSQPKQKSYECNQNFRRHSGRCNIDSFLTFDGELEHASSEAEWYEINIRKSNVELLMYHSTGYLPCSILFLYDSLWNSCI